MNAPIYLQIKENLELAILSGRISPGQKLPSVRKLAEQFQINPNTVQRVMAELRKTGLITGRQGQPMIVISDTDQISVYKQEKVIALVHDCIQQLKSLNYQETEIVNLISSVTRNLIDT